MRMQQLPTVEFITHCGFWQTGSGFMARTREMVRFLSSRSCMTVIFLGYLTEQDEADIARLEFPVRVTGLNVPVGASREEKSSAYASLAARKAKVDVYIVDKTENTYILDSLPQGSERWIDTHDLVSERTRKLQGHEVGEHFPMTQAEEIEALGRYDLIICIQRREWEKVVGWCGREKVVCVPHPVTVASKTPRGTSNRIGFVASSWHANAYGLRDFLRFVWERVYRTGASLHVYGRVADVLVDVNLPGVHFHGFVENLDDCYKSIDIAINPVTYGAGLKIKSVEALANGLPLVTTPEGASGLEELDGEALLIAADWGDFAAKLEALVNDPDRCARLGKRGAGYSRQNFSPEACFAPLVERLDGFSWATGTDN
jgi:glycosyltransferase involved in cell wall biosynthesis